MAHITIYEAPADGPETEWGDQVSDTEYAQQPGSSRYSPKVCEENGMVFGPVELIVLVVAVIALAYILRWAIRR